MSAKGDLPLLSQGKANRLKKILKKDWKMKVKIKVNRGIIRTNMEIEFEGTTEEFNEFLRHFEIKWA